MLIPTLENATLRMLSQRRKLLNAKQINAGLHSTQSTISNVRSARKKFAWVIDFLMTTNVPTLSKMKRQHRASYYNHHTSNKIIIHSFKKTAGGMDRISQFTLKMSFST